ncbi:MAG: hypothetical protein AMXMBFR84_45540 [Candidatus Hydrogenedentota bacterium]
MVFFPTFGQFLWLVCSCLLVCGLGYVATLPRWRPRESLPVWYTLIVGFAGLAIYSLATVSMIERHQATSEQSLGHVRDVLELNPGAQRDTAPVQSEEDVIAQDSTSRVRLVTLLAWTLLFWIPPAVFFVRLFLNSLATQAVRAIPFTDESVNLHAEVEFKVAKGLREKGDIRGALRVYRSYPQNRQGAWMEAGKMLEAEGLMIDAVEHYRDMVEMFGPASKSWPEASYRLAKLLETQPGKEKEARDMLMAIYQRSPKSEFGHLSEKSLQGFQISSEDLLAQLDAGFGPVSTKGPAGSPTTPNPS